MAATISKRQQARNERALQDLIRTVPGNDQCADCQARNPGWASWNLGVFLCMRCASLHRKLGTHISKVKSLSMDTWTTDQVESMKRNGNVAVNKAYNPRNVKVDIPLDVDEVDMAMERFIRKKYQDRSLDSTKPRAPNPSDTGIAHYREESPPPPLPPKKGKLFGFGMRASSSAFPHSKHGKNKLPPDPDVENAHGFALDNHRSPRRGATNAKSNEADLSQKLLTLREMGFIDEEQNSATLTRTNGDLQRTIDSLVKSGQKKKRSVTAPVLMKPMNNVATIPTFSDAENDTTKQLQQGPTNPFDVPTTSNPSGLSFSSQERKRSVPTGMPDPKAIQSNNPFGIAPGSGQPTYNLEHSFQGMQISQPLFPHSTGGYPVQNPQNYDVRLQHSMTPPVPAMSQPYGYVASPPIMYNKSNPFFQPTQQVQNPWENPYALPNLPPSNPFFTQASSPMTPVQQLQPPPTFGHTYNPFGIPPNESQHTPSHQSVPTNLPDQSFFPQSISDQNSQAHPVNSNVPSVLDAGLRNQRSFSQPLLSVQQQHDIHQTPFQYALAPQPNLPQPHFSAQQAQAPQIQYNTQAQPPHPLAQQATGRFDKNSILALYNYPHLAPQPPSLPSIPEPSDPQPSITSSAPSSGPFSTKRSATMPLTSFSAATGSRNPFLANGSGDTTPGVAAGAGVGGAARQHVVSQDSPAGSRLENGRHSPDVFASLSARYVR